MQIPQLQNCVFLTLAECSQTFAHICNETTASERLLCLTKNTLVQVTSTVRVYRYRYFGVGTRSLCS